MAKADRATLRLELIDVLGRSLKEQVDVMLRHQVLNEVLKVTADASKPIDIAGLRGAPQGLYRLEIDPPSYQRVSRFVNLGASGITPVTVIFPIDPLKVAKVDFPPYAALPDDVKKLLERSGNVLSFEGKKGKALYGALDDLRKAGLLNIVAKARATPLTSSDTVLPFVQTLREIRGDRFFTNVSPELREETKHSVLDGLFREVDGSMHHPPEGFKPAGSFKTLDRYGNLQLSFFMNSDGDCVADIDIDDAAGIEHVFQVVHNALSGAPTHPYNIRDILIGFQTIDPGYRFEV